VIFNEDTFFDSWEFRYIISLFDTDPLEAKVRFEEYLRNYPNDYSAYTYYTFLLIILGNFEEAESVLEDVQNSYVNDYNFMKDKKKVDLMEKNIIFDTLKLLSYQERYEELFEFCQNHINEIKQLKLNSLDFYCKQKLGIQCPEDKVKLSYLINQIANYSESEFLEHIKKHLADYNQDLDVPNESIFGSDFTIAHVLEEVKKYIGSDKRLYSGFYENLYVFKYNGCGRVNNKLVDYFKIVVLHNTDHFITMFPATGCENLPYIDLNYLIHEDSKPKMKKLSQIDKFNQRYKPN